MYLALDDVGVGLRVLAHQVKAFMLEDTAHVGTDVMSNIGDALDHVSGAGAVVECSEYHMVDVPHHDGTETHGARFNSTVYDALVVMLAQVFRAREKSIQLGVTDMARARIARAGTPAHHPVAVHHHGTDGQVAATERGFGLLECLPHEQAVINSLDVKHLLHP